MHKHGTSTGSELPEAVERIAARQELGQLLSIHPARNREGGNRVGGIIAIIIGVALSGVYAFSYNSTFSWLPWWQSIILPLIGIIWLIAGCWLLFVPLFRPSLVIYVYAEGVVYAERQLEVIPWRRMERIWKLPERGAKKVDVPTYVIRRNDGCLFEFRPGLFNLDALGALLEQEITRHLLPRALAVFTSGEAVLFEAVAVSEQGIVLREGRRRLGWSELTGFRVAEKQLEWYAEHQPQPWAVVPLEAVPNVEVLQGLIDYARRALLRETSPKIVAYRTGASVDFGLLRVNQQGIRLNSDAQLIPWSDIAGVGVSEHEVIIGRKDTGQWYTFPDWMIQDAPVLKDLVEYVLQKKQ